MPRRAHLGVEAVRFAELAELGEKGVGLREVAVFPVGMSDG
jgi:hypothetical protein